MGEMLGKTLAMPVDERMICCARANDENCQHSSPGRLSWYFAERAMPGLNYVATIYGYMGSGPHKGGKENV